MIVELSKFNINFLSVFVDEIGIYLAYAAI